MVSIHALLAECDFEQKGAQASAVGFNPRTPCGVRRAAVHPKNESLRGFNPRTPCGVRQIGRLAVAGYKKFQSTHSLRSATNFTGLSRAHSPVSIHALLAECDTMIISMNPYDNWFQSTHSLRSATIPFWPKPPLEAVSIHALLAECDGGQHVLPACFSGFNPRTPCGVRRLSVNLNVVCIMFQSTHSLRSATAGTAKNK